ncbi:MAG: PVC-type heme-binding CxxCH protein [Planctomycetales bacterium]
MPESTCACGWSRGGMWLLAALILELVSGTSLTADEPAPLGLKAPPGFKITRYADDALAHDIFSMTIDTAGRVVVSGPGYVRILIDSDGDGIADRTKDFASGPQSGAQGLYFHGRDLFCTGDDGLICYFDKNGDDKADGPPEVFLKIKTGSEHHAHAVRRGPDGWWYLIAGNFADVSSGHATEPTSPVRNPHGGVIMRLKPDLSGGEILADGFRNAYDFDFDGQGELFTYDSDGEREISLPWYQPTKLFHVLPGAEHGWITEGCKRPDYVIDSPPVVAATGRGSPTGVACYRHTQFPEAYRGGLFVLDWTFGRVFSVPLQRQGGTYAPQQAKEFITTQGEFGFAPTDVDVGMDGSLYVCVGGRGTQGTVYKVTYVGAGDAPASPAARPALLDLNDHATSAQKLKACVDAPQPQSSWSRVRWVPVANKLGAQPFLSLALDEQQPLAHRIRAVEILTELFTGIPGTAAEILATAKSAELRGRAAWSLGAKPPQGLTLEVLVPFLNDPEAMVRRRALESLARLPRDPAVLIPSIARCLGDGDRTVRLAAARLLPRMKPAQLKEVADITRKIGWQAALSTTLGYVWQAHEQNKSFSPYAVEVGRRALEGKHPAAQKLEAVRILQMAIGDLGGDEQTAAVYEGYAPLHDLSEHERELDPLRITVAQLFPTGDRALDLELARLAAMLAPINDSLYSHLLEQIKEDTSPIDDIHYLIAASRLPVEPGKAQRELVAQAFLGLDRKIAARKLPLDSNWNERLGELYAEFVSRDDQLPEVIIGKEGFGRPGHVLFMTRLPAEQLPAAIAALTKAVQSDPEYPWNNDVVFVMSHGRTPEHYALIRQQYEKFELRMASLMALASNPQPEDREKFVGGLEASQLDVLTSCVTALEFLPEEKHGEELVALVKLARRLQLDKSEFALRERVVRLVERNSGEDFEFVYGSRGFIPQPDAMEKMTAWLSTEFPEIADLALGGSEASLQALKDRLAEVHWETGDLERGRKLYTARGCAQCHGGGSGLGPDLAGVAGRFSRDDLFLAIALPNRDVSPRYQTTRIETKSGKVYTGMIVYGSNEGFVLRNATNQTFRIESSDIESRRVLPISLMPEGLLKDLTDTDLADLYAFLKGEPVRTAQRPDEEEPEAEQE